MTVQARNMKQTKQNQKCKPFDVGSIVQAPVANVDTTEADGKNLTLIVVEIVHQKGTWPPMYWLASQMGVISRL